MPTVHLDRHVVCRHDIAARGLNGGVREGSSIEPAHYSDATLRRRIHQLPQQTL